MAGGKLIIGTALVATMLLASMVAAPSDAGRAKPAASKKTAGLVANFAPYPPMFNPIRIGISCRASVARFAVWAPGFVFLNSRPVFELQPGLPYSIANGRITEMGSGKTYQIPGDARVWVTASDYRIWTANRWYRGSLELINLGGRVTVINLLDLEDYLLGVVPSEMPASWHPEALRAQAVAARSYAIAHMGDKSKWRSEGFDLVPDVRDQAYKGLAAEANSTWHAVHDTAGLILKDSGKVKPGFYRAWVGDDLDENLNIRKSNVDKKHLEKITAVPNIVGVTIKKWDPATGNAHDIQVMGTKKSREVYGVALAKMLGFSTAGILDVQEQGSYWVFTYRGPGNGARGLSQHGANMLASHGWRFDQILTQYYQDNDGKLRLDYVNNFRAPPPKPSANKAAASASRNDAMPGELDEK